MPAGFQSLALRQEAFMSHTGKITAVQAGLAFLSGGLSASASDGMHYVAAENRFLGPEIS